MGLTNSDYTIGWISALPVELAAAKAMMEKPLHPMLPQDPQDTNTYTLGQIGKHNVVLAISSTMGTNAAAHAAADLLRSFPNIRFGLMVGIGGGVPGVPNANSMLDIRLGDVVVSYPEQQHGGVIQYDFGTETQASNSNHFTRKGHLNRPPAILLTALRNLQADAMMQPLVFQKHYEDMLENYPAMSMQYFRPETDKLYSSCYAHKGSKADCSQCSDDELIERIPRTMSVVHYGLIGSANRVLRNALERDRLNEAEGIVCFEMEAAGLMNEFPCVVIRGICDYCDSHKSKHWQAYASAIAAAYTKELLLNIAPSSINSLPDVSHLSNLVDQHLLEMRQTNESLARVTSKLESAEKVAALSRHTECLKMLNCVHPRFDKTGLEDRKGGLLKDAYKWGLRTAEYKSWQETGGLLWIKGNPGKGKTMLMCGIITELEDNKAYFFCQATVNTNNTAIAVLRGLIRAALDQNVPLTNVLNDKIEQASKLPQESAFYVYSDIIDEILEAQEMVILIDALDECLSGQDMLLRFIVRSSALHSSRWLVTSRNVVEIHEHLNQASRLSLEVNEESVADAVQVFIEHKVHELAKAKEYDDDLQSFVSQYLLDNAKGTFLWVSLVCSSLSKVRPRHTKTELLEYPSGLKAVYQRMIKSIEEAKDAAKLKQILSIICIAFRPMTLHELSSLSDLPKEDILYMEDFVNACGSFLTIQRSSVQFVHQSAKDFLVDHEPQHVFASGKPALHHRAFVKSLEAQQSLRRNMYSLTEPGISLENIVTPYPDPLQDIKYACLYWIEHLLISYEGTSIKSISPTDASLISNFLESKCLYWIEALSLLGHIYPVAIALSKLVSTMQAHSGLDEPHFTQCLMLQEIVNDVVQFIRYFQYALARYPLQVYVSGLLFCPTRSLIRQQFWHEAPKWANIEKGLEESWPAHLTLDINTVKFLKWSTNTEKIATWNPEGIRIWDAASGQLLTSVSVYGHEFAFADNDTALMVIEIKDALITLWSTVTGELLKAKYLADSTFPEYDSYHTRWDFLSSLSLDTQIVACARSWLDWIEIHCTSTGKIIQRIQLQNSSLHVSQLMLNIDKSLVAIAGWLNTRRSGIVEVLDIESGQVLWKIASDVPDGIRFSKCSTILVMVSEGLEIWDWQNDKLLYTLPKINHRGDGGSQVRQVIVLEDTILVSNATELEEWSLKSRIKHQTHAICPTTIIAAAICGDGRKIAIANFGGVRVWHLDRSVDPLPATEDLSSVASLKCIYLKENTIYTVLDGETSSISKRSLASQVSKEVTLHTQINSDNCTISPNRSYIALWDADYGDLEAWDLDHHKQVLQILSDGSNRLVGMAWGPGVAQITICWRNEMVWIECWSINEARKIRRLEIPSYHQSLPDGYTHLCWSSTGSHLLLSSKFGLDLWAQDRERWTNVSDDIDFDTVDESCMKFSADGSLFAFISMKRTLMLFKTNTQNMLFSVKDHGFSSLLSVDEHWIKTDRAWYSVPYSPMAADASVSSRPSNHYNIEYDSSREQSWLRYGRTDIIWLPQEYRPPPQCWDSDGSMIILGIDATRFVVVNVHWDPSLGLESQSAGETKTNPAYTYKRKGSPLAVHLKRQRDR